MTNSDTTSPPSVSMTSSPIPSQDDSSAVAPVTSEGVYILPFQLSGIRRLERQTFRPQYLKDYVLNYESN